MLKITWHAHLSFGLIDIPVGLALATPESSKSSNVAFKTIHTTCLTATKRKVWCPECERELKPDEVGKGWLRQKGEPLVLVDENHLAAIEADESRSMEIHSFCPVESIDPIWFDRSYFLVPDDERQKGYAIILQALEDTGMGGLCSFIRAGQEKWGLVRPVQGILGLETLFLAEDIRSTESVELTHSPQKAELSLAMDYIKAMNESFDGDVLVSEYRRDLHSMLETIGAPKKAKKKPVVEDTTLAALRASVEAVKKQRKKAA